ncbi:helix-turn-helix domain-containing protein [Clostridium massiliamazoniense]|uniref:helix-turn-helix domain-containing protein n=1 Tax=Clostridium massiliamazoniense TaxID=1347366 RepID=UPI0006D80A6F|nr:helix-turn-helix transcriptional regulator [Clostridium massiliamazoniense]
MPIKNKLLQVRLQLGYRKQIEFAEFLGLNKTQYNKYENNMQQPSIEIFYKISKKLGISIDELIEFEEE